jgi:hypothetical protein
MSAAHIFSYDATHPTKPYGCLCTHCGVAAPAPLRDGRLSITEMLAFYRRFARSHRACPAPAASTEVAK